MKRKIIKNVAGRIPRVKEKVLGTAYVGKRYFCGTVGEVDKETIKAYIENQGKIHTNGNFKIVEEDE